MNKRLLLVIAFVIGIVVAKAQTMYFISMFDTNDKNIGAGMKTERTLVNNEMLTIAGYLEEFGYDSQFRDYYGSNCGKASLMQVINDLQVNSEDIVVFYYGGHGARAFNNSEDRFPQMCLGEPNEKNWVPSSLIRNMIAKKNPRLTVVLTGCCNKEGQGVTIKSIVAQSSGYTMANINKEAYKKLFIDSKGVIQLTSSRAGEYSWCTNQGSFFALALLDILDQVGKGTVQADWQQVCQRVKDIVSAIDISTPDGVIRQNPDYEVRASVGTVTTRRRDETSITRKVNDTEYDLTQDIELLLDKSRSTNERLSMISTVLSKHFTSGAKVLTVGRDMQTVVDYEDAEVFLRRIVMSPFIKQINIIEQTGNKNTQVTVHEVRTR